MLYWYNNVIIKYTILGVNFVDVKNVRNAVIIETEELDIIERACIYEGYGCNYDE